MTTRCTLNRLFNDGDITQHQKDEFYRAARAFYVMTYKYALSNLPHSDDLLNNAEVINWETRTNANIDGITYFVNRCTIQACCLDLLSGAAEPMSKGLYPT